MNLVIGKSGRFSLKISLIVSILQRGRKSWIEIVCIFSVKFIVLEISRRSGGNSLVIVLVSVLVKSLNTIVHIDSKGETCIDSVFVLIGDIVSLISQEIIPVSKHE